MFVLQQRDSEMKRARFVYTDKSDDEERPQTPMSPAPLPVVSMPVDRPGSHLTAEQARLVLDKVFRRTPVVRTYFKWGAMTADSAMHITNNHLIESFLKFIGHGDHLSDFSVDQLLQQTYVCSIPNFPPAGTSLAAAIAFLKTSDILHEKGTNRGAMWRNALYGLCRLAAYVKMESEEGCLTPDPVTIAKVFVHAWSSTGYVLFSDLLHLVNYTRAKNRIHDTQITRLDNQGNDHRVDEGTKEQLWMTMTQAADFVCRLYRKDIDVQQKQTVIDAWFEVTGARLEHVVGGGGGHNNKRVRNDTAETRDHEYRMAQLAAATRRYEVDRQAETRRYELDCETELQKYTIAHDQR